MSKKHPIEYVYGIHAVNAVLQQAPERVLTLQVLQGRHDQSIQQLLLLARECGLSVQTLTRHDLDKLAAGQNHQGVIAKCRMAAQYHESDIETLLQNLTVPPFILVLDGVQDPHNLGACLRTADAAGVHLVIAPKDNSAGLTATVRKVACGAAESIPFIQVTNLARTLRLLKEQGVWLYGTAGEATKSIHETKLTGSLGIVMGAEGKGMRRLTRELCDELLYIPMLGAVESLNVSVAAGICLYEALRQRRAGAL